MTGSSAAWQTTEAKKQEHLRIGQVFLLMIKSGDGDCRFSQWQR
jgi:hypothetical protein